ncbi:MAG TPA: hypothetical protein VF209_00440 [Patescibacteria group bacterium]
MEITNQTVTQLVIDALTHHVSTIEPDQINTTDHLEYDLLLNIRQDVPKIIRRVQQELAHQEVEITFDSEALEDFLTEAEEDDDKGTVGELISFIKDELLYN